MPLQTALDWQQSQRIRMGAQKKSGIWQWSNGENVANNNWSPDQPDDSGSCLQLHINFRYDDANCSSKRAYICEKSSSDFK